MSKSLEYDPKVVHKWRVIILRIADILNYDQSCIILWCLIQNLYELAVYCCPREDGKPIKLKHLQALKDTDSWDSFCKQLYKLRNNIVHNPTDCYKSELVEVVMSNQELAWLVEFCMGDMVLPVNNVIINYKKYLSLK